MSVPATIDTCEQYLFADVDKMVEAGIPEIIRKRLLRLRDMYNTWLQFPRMKDIEIVSKLEERYDVSKSTAYEDVRLIKRLLGDLNITTKDYDRFRVKQMLDESFEKARRTNDARAMAMCANYYGKYTMCDKEEAQDRGYDKIIVQPFEPTEDPTVLGLRPIPNLRDKIKKKIGQYWNDDVQTVDFEEIEYNENDIFKPKLKPDETVSE